MTRRPSVFVFGILPILLAALPQGHDALLFDRTAILGGEFWRLWTGHWIHVSPSHLFWNVGGLSFTGAWLEARHPGLLLRYTALAAPLISIGLLVLEPNMITYGGLSGLGTGIVVLLGITLCRRPGFDRTIGVGTLFLLAARLLPDLIQDTALLSHFDLPAVQASTTAHLLGTLLAVIGNFAGLKPCFAGPISEDQFDKSGNPESRHPL